jgi:Arc/MetJ-type ribon-helix-helix transcriptional regulator
MRDTLTISLPDQMRRKVQKAAKEDGLSQSEFVRNALKSALFRRALRSARAELVPQARKKGLFTDEDVFRIVS